MIRAFVGLPLPEEHGARLGPYLAACGAAAPNFRWVRAESLHLTLRFIGGVEEAVLERVCAELGRIDRSSYQASIGGQGSFGGSRRTTVIWLHLVEGREPSAQLATECERACQSAGLEPETRPFRPHLTLARSRSRNGEHRPDLPPPPVLPAWRVDEFVLYQSRLRGGRPPEYEPLARFPLSG